jgi:hypothetical protein
MSVLKAGTLYFALVFAAGFVLGTIRALWVVPSLGARTAELIEAPIMVVVSLFTASWVARRLSLDLRPAVRIGTGLVALALMLVVEFTFVLWVRGLSLREYFATRDRVSGAAYVAALGIFALMPFLMGRGKHAYR